MPLETYFFWLCNNVNKELKSSQVVWTNLLSLTLAIGWKITGLVRKHLCLSKDFSKCGAKLEPRSRSVFGKICDRRQLKNLRNCRKKKRPTDLEASRSKNKKKEENGSNYSIFNRYFDDVNCGTIELIQLRGQEVTTMRYTAVAPGLITKKNVEKLSNRSWKKWHLELMLTTTRRCSFWVLFILKCCMRIGGLALELQLLNPLKVLVIWTVMN